MINKENRLVKVYVIAFLLFAIGFIIYLRNRNLLYEIEDFSAKNWVVAWLLMLSLSVLRAFVPFLPSFAFYAMSGRIFPGNILPLAVSFSSVTLLYSLSYLIGRMKKYDQHRAFSAFGFEQYRKIREGLFLRVSAFLENKYFGRLLLLNLSPFPQKLLGRVCGRMRLAFWQFLIASLLGALPQLISVTMLGKSILDVSSPLFGVSLLATITIALVSLIVFR